MPVTNVTHDVDTRTLTITAEFAAPKARDRQTYGDPRQLEKVWGPPEYPATVVEHGLKPGGRVTYYMTGPGGEKYRDTGRSSRSTSRNSFAFKDGFADEDFNPVDSLPVSTITYTFTESGGRTTATFVFTFETAEGLQKVLDIGVVEGSTGAINQIDALLAGG